MAKREHTRNGNDNMQQKSSEHFSGCNRENQQGHRPAGAKMKTTKSSKRWLHRYAGSTRKLKETLSTHEWGRKTASRKHRKGWGPHSLFVMQVFREGHRVPQQLSWAGLAAPRGSRPTQDMPGSHEGVTVRCSCLGTKSSITASTGTSSSWNPVCSQLFEYSQGCF